MRYRVAIRFAIEGDLRFISHHDTVRLFERAIARAGLPVCTWHALRHGYASLMLSNGIPLSVVSELLGHSGIAITKDTYGAIADSAKYAATARLGELVG